MERIERPNKRKTICFWFDYVRSAFNFNAIIQWVVRSTAYSLHMVHCAALLYAFNDLTLFPYFISLYSFSISVVVCFRFCFLCFLFSFHRFLLFRCIRSLGAIACRCTETQTHSHVSRIWKSPSRSYTINCTRHWKLCYTFTVPNTTTQQHHDA